MKFPNIVFPKIVNKKMIIFVVLFVAFVYFSGILNVMREGLETYKAPPGTLKVQNMNCCDCLNKGCPTNPYQKKCMQFFKDRNITKEKRKCVYDKATKTSYFEPILPSGYGAPVAPSKPSAPVAQIESDNYIIGGIDCSGCKKSRTDPNCNAKCRTNINYANYNCNFEKGSTMCRKISNAPVAAIASNNYIIGGIDCSGCKNSRTDPNCNAECRININKLCQL